MAYMTVFQSITILSILFILISSILILTIVSNILIEVLYCFIVSLIIIILTTITTMISILIWIIVSYILRTAVASAGPRSASGETTAEPAAHISAKTFKGFLPKSLITFLPKL